MDQIEDLFEVGKNSSDCLCNLTKFQCADGKLKVTPQAPIYREVLKSNRLTLKFKKPAIVTLKKRVKI